LFTFSIISMYKAQKIPRRAHYVKASPINFS
jgi:hypothetical protein